MKKGLLFILMVGASVCLSAQEKGKTEGKAYTVETCLLYTSDAADEL